MAELEGRDPSSAGCLSSFLRQPWLLLVAFHRMKLLKMELAVVLFMLGRHLYDPLYEQYYYFIDGSDILKNTSFVFPNGSYCVSSEMVDNYTGNANSYKVDESFSNHLVAYGQLANTIPAIVFTIMLGPLMDRYGRKMGIILPVTGKALQGIFSIFIVKYTLDPYYFILANFIGGLFGDFACVLAASFAYVADISSLRWRSFRVGVVESGLAFGEGAGTLITGYWLRESSCSFIPPLWLYVALNIFIAVYVALLVPESLTRSEREKLRSGSRKGWREYVEGVKLYCGGLSLSSTWKLYVCTIVIIVAVLNMYGGSLIEVYFLKAAEFDFTTLQTGLYQALRAASQGTAALVFMVLLTVVGAGDSWVILVGVTFHCVCNVLVGLADKLWQLFAIASVKGIEGTAWAGTRGLMSKLVNSEQQGALFSIIGSIEAAAHLLASALWPLIFPLTLQHNMRPGMTYIFMAALGISILPLVLSLLLLKKATPSPLSNIVGPVNPITVNASNSSGYDSSESSEDDYRPLLNKSWTSNEVHGPK